MNNNKLNVSLKFAKKYSPYLYELIKMTMDENGDTNNIKIKIKSLNIPDFNNTIITLNKWATLISKYDFDEKINDEFTLNIKLSSFYEKLNINECFSLMYLADYLNIQILIKSLVKKIVFEFLRKLDYNGVKNVFDNPNNKITRLCYILIIKFAQKERLYELAESLYKYGRENEIIEKTEIY
jgi:hypothetical protein